MNKDAIKVPVTKKKRSALYRMFETDKTAEQDGIWLDTVATERDGKEVMTSFLCRRAGGSNMNYNRSLESKTKNHRRQIERGTIDLSIAKQISVDVFLDSVLIGWENVEGRNGEWMEFSPENAKQLFEDLPDLLTDLNAQVNNLDLFKVLDEEAKNSESSSSIN